MDDFRLLLTEAIGARPVTDYRRWKAERSRPPEWDGLDALPVENPPRLRLVAIGWEGDPSAFASLPPAWRPEWQRVEGTDWSAATTGLDDQDIVLFVPRGAHIRAEAIAALLRAAANNPETVPFFGDEETDDRSCRFLPGFDTLLTFQLLQTAMAFGLRAGTLRAFVKGEAVPERPAGLALHRPLVRRGREHRLPKRCRVFSHGSPGVGQLPARSPVKSSLMWRSSSPRATVWNSCAPASRALSRRFPPVPRLSSSTMKARNRKRSPISRISRAIRTGRCSLRRGLQFLEALQCRSAGDACQGADLPQQRYNRGLAGLGRTPLRFRGPAWNVARWVRGCSTPPVASSMPAWRWASGGMPGMSTCISRGMPMASSSARAATTPCSRLTGACLAVERAKFEAIGGFDEENLPVDLNDIDLCLRLGEKGWQTIYAAGAVLVHHESASRGRKPGNPRYAREKAYFAARWRHLRRADPHFHPALSLLLTRPSLG